MRPLEFVLILACFALLIVPRQRLPLPSKVLAGLAVVVAILHVLFEGYRWQMFPAYLVVVVYALLNLTRLPIPSSRPKSVIKVLGIFATLNALALAYFFPVDAFEPLIGDYPVGTSVFYYKDASRPEIYTETSNDVRELMMQVWYPAAPNGRAICRLPA